MKTLDTCEFDSLAQGRPHYPRFRAFCHACAVRELAAGPLYHASGLDGSLSAPYRKALGLLFGDDIRAGHAIVKAEHDRQKAQPI